MKKGRFEEAIENSVVLDICHHILDEPMDIKLAVLNEYCELARLIKKGDYNENISIPNMAMHMGNYTDPAGINRFPVTS